MNISAVACANVGIRTGDNANEKGAIGSSRVGPPGSPLPGETPPRGKSLKRSRSTGMSYIFFVHFLARNVVLIKGNISEVQ